eukprot:759189-Hanusia_phi.AAC.4
MTGGYRGQGSAQRAGWYHEGSVRFDSSGRVRSPTSSHVPDPDADALLQSPVATRRHQPRSRDTRRGPLRT